MGDYIIRAIDKEKSIRIFVAETTNIIEEARKIHNTTPVATAALGRTITATAIMSKMMKGEKDKISLQFKGDGPIGMILVVGNSKGEVKGYVSNPYVDLSLKASGKLDVGRAVGRGRLTVIRDLGLKEPYIGQSNIITGEIAEDLTNYFATSEQQPSAVALGVLVDRDYTVKASGGYIVQVLPNISDKNLSKLEEIISKAEPISSLVDKGYTPEEILSEVFGELDMTVTEKHDISLICDCSRDKIESVLISLGVDELSNIIKEEGKAEVGCQFCNTQYVFNEEELKDIINNIKK